MVARHNKTLRKPYVDEIIYFCSQITFDEKEKIAGHL